MDKSLFHCMYKTLAERVVQYFQEDSKNILKLSQMVMKCKEYKSYHKAFCSGCNRLTQLAGKCAYILMHPFILSRNTHKVLPGMLPLPFFHVARISAE